MQRAARQIIGITKGARRNVLRILRDTRLRMDGKNVRNESDRQNKQSRNCPGTDKGEPVATHPTALHVLHYISSILKNNIDSIAASRLCHEIQRRRRLAMLYKSLTERTA